jgi:hypothetical protein
LASWYRGFNTDSPKYKYAQEEEPKHKQKQNKASGGGAFEKADQVNNQHQGLRNLERNRVLAEQWQLEAIDTKPCLVEFSGQPLLDPKASISILDA